MKRVHRWLCSVLVCLALVGCGRPAAKAGGGEAVEGPEGSQWRLVEVAGAAVPQLAGGRRPHLMLDAASRQATGFAGCNNFFGGYLLKGDELTFGLLGSTQMACPEMEASLERHFFQALEASRRWRTQGGGLLLLDDAGRIVARFVR